MPAMLVGSVTGQRETSLLPSSVRLFLRAVLLVSGILVGFVLGIVGFFFVRLGTRRNAPV